MSRYIHIFWTFFKLHSWHHPVTLWFPDTINIFFFYGRNQAETNIGTYNFKAQIQPSSSFCSGLNGHRLTFLFLIHSSPERTSRRSVLRQTWGNLQMQNLQETRLLFVMGRPQKTRQRLQKKKSLRSPKMDVAWTKDRVSIKSGLESWGITFLPDWKPP